jgi:dolichol-phosphate mannosyltransferase
MSDKAEGLTGVSVVTTTWNEVENIRDLIRRIKAALNGTVFEIIVVDDNSTDGTLQVAEPLVNLAVGKTREGQTKGLIYGAKMSKYPIVVTIDSDLENPPELIPSLIEKIREVDVVVASRRSLPRFSEKCASKTLGRLCDVSDFYSNFRAFRREAIVDYMLRGGETFGGELLIAVKKRGFKISEILYESPPRRTKPRIGGSLKANLRITAASLKCWLIYWF